METALEKPEGIDKRYEDFIAPLMQYCVALNSEYIKFKLPVNLLSGKPNSEVLLSLFSQIDIENDIRQKEPDQNYYGWVEYERGDYQTITLWFMHKPKLSESIMNQLQTQLLLG